MKLGRILSVAWLFFAAWATVSCVGEGAEGSTGIDCGDHGSEHAGHCHCDLGYLFNGETCVTPDAVTEVCHTPDAGVEDTSEHHHDACRCPAAEECPCDGGDIDTFGGQDYCVPHLD